MSGRVAVRDIDRKREADYRARHGRDDARIDYRHYYGDRRNARRGASDGYRWHRQRHDRGSGSSFVYIGGAAPTQPAEPAGTSAHTDEFNNLVVNHATGYKQIIVGGALVLKRAGVAPEDLFKPAPESAPAAADTPTVIYGDGSRQVASGGVNITRPPIVHYGREGTATDGCATSIVVVHRKSVVVVRRNNNQFTGGRC